MHDAQPHFNNNQKTSLNIFQMLKKWTETFPGVSTANTIAKRKQEGNIFKKKKNAWKRLPEKDQTSCDLFPHSPTQPKQQEAQSRIPRGAPKELLSYEIYFQLPSGLSLSDPSSAVLFRLGLAGARPAIKHSSFYVSGAILGSGNTFGVFLEKNPQGPPTAARCKTAAWWGWAE